MGGETHTTEDVLLRFASVIFILGFAPALGCNKSDAQSSLDLPATQTVATRATTSAAANGPTSRLYLAGINSPEDVRRFLQQLQKAAAANDRPAVIALIHFPFTTYSCGTAVKTYSSESVLERDFQLIFTPKVLKAIEQAQYETLFVNWQGVMIGRGDVWLDQTSEGIKIKAING